jgi:predicted  nucleic acid-binding Zn-ribbon protein
LSQLRGFYDVNQQNLAKIRSAEEEAKAANQLKQAARAIDEIRVEIIDLKAQKDEMTAALTAANEKFNSTESERTKASQQEIIDKLTPQIEALQSKITRKKKTVTDYDDAQTTAENNAYEEAFALVTAKEAERTGYQEEVAEFGRQLKKIENEKWALEDAAYLRDGVESWDDFTEEEKTAIKTAEDAYQEKQ